MSVLLSAEEWSALTLSLEAGLFATAVVAIPGIVLGWLLARRNFPGKLALDVLVHLPLVLPPVVVGYLLLLIVGRRGPIGGLLHRGGIDIAFALPGVVIASTAMALPLMVRSVRLAIELVDPGLEQAAAALGAGPWRRLWTITLPLAGRGIATGLVLAFARSLGEFGATITLAGNIDGRTRTLPTAIYTAIESPGGDHEAMRLTVISLIVAVGAMAASELMARRRR